MSSALPPSAASSPGGTPSRFRLSLALLRPFSHRKTASKSFNDILNRTTPSLSFRVSVVWSVSGLSGEILILGVVRALERPTAILPFLPASSSPSLFSRADVSSGAQDGGGCRVPDAVCDRQEAVPSVRLVCGHACSPSDQERRRRQGPPARLPSALTRGEGQRPRDHGC